jgi:Ribonuclease G/E
MKKMTNAKKTAIEVGAGLAAAGAAVAAAGYYFYGSTGAKKHRKIAAKWATDMKKEVIKEAKKLEVASPKAFANIVDHVAKTYQAARNVDATEVKRAAKELKENWDSVQKETKRTVRKGVSRAKTVVKKAVKKVVKKAAKRSK